MRACKPARSTESTETIVLPKWIILSLSLSQRERGREPEPFSRHTVSFGSNDGNAIEENEENHTLMHPDADEFVFEKLKIK